MILSVCEDATVISKKQIANKLKMNFCFSLKMPPSVLKRTRIPSAEPESASSNIAAKNSVKRIGAITHPCLTPVVEQKRSEEFPLIHTRACLPVCICFKTFMNLDDKPCFATMFHRASLGTKIKGLC